MGAICTSLEISSLTRIRFRSPKDGTSGPSACGSSGSNLMKLIALSQFGQMTFTGLPAFLQARAASCTTRPKHR